MRNRTRYADPQTLTTAVEYQRLGGRAYLVLKRLPEDAPTEHCPFCGWRHVHGKGDGHRSPHCFTTPYWYRGRQRFPRTTVTAGDGTQLSVEDGYIVRTVGETT